MPLLVHAVPRPLRSDGEAVELTRQTDGEIADVDHLLYFAFTLRLDLPHLECHQGAEWFLVFAEQVPEFADVVTPLGCGKHPPSLERVNRRPDHALIVVAISAGDGGDLLSGRGVLHGQLGTAGVQPAPGEGTGIGVLQPECGENSVTVHRRTS